MLHLLDFQNSQNNINLSPADLTNSEATMTNPESLSLNKLSGNLEKLLTEKSEYEYSDTEIVVEEIPVGVHRCILAARSQFFHQLFRKENNGDNKKQPKYLMSDLVPYGAVGYEAFIAFLQYLYTGRLEPSPPQVSNCVHDACLHDSCRPAINFAAELLYASAAFQMKELVLLSQRHLLTFVDKAFVEDVIPILLAAFHCQLDQLFNQCIERVAKSDLDNVYIDKELPTEVSSKIKLFRRNYHPEAETEEESSSTLLEKNTRRIFKALDSDDVELMKLLLIESKVSLNEIYALHYAVAYSDTKVVKEILALGLADVNLRNSRGYTVLHVAARRKEPSLLVALLTKGARVSETTLDGRNAVSICRQLTRPKDYNEITKQGQKTNKDRLCINILEREMRNSMPVKNSQVEFADLKDLESRVALAQLLFPAEAGLAKEVADADITSAYPGISILKQKLKDVDSSETPSLQTKRIQLRLQELLKTVEMGRHYFPHCAEVLDKFLEDDEMPDAFFLEKGTAEEQNIKKRRFTELKEDVQEAFYKDIAHNNWSSSPRKVAASRRRLKN